MQAIPNHHHPPHHTSKDVLSLRGAAAQQTEHPGNLAYYGLCENRYEEYAALPDGHPSRDEICEAIVDEILGSGGNFRSHTGGNMSRAAAVEKTRSRMRQIEKPKIRPNLVGENDVVFCMGASNHLYAGNAKWRSLLDHFVTDYYKEFISNGMKDHGKQNKRQQYQIDVINKITSIVRSRGGTFRRGDNLEALDDDEIMKKTNARFVDLKKELRKGRIFPRCYSAPIKVEGESSAAAAENNNAAARTLAANERHVAVEERYVLKNAGCTSVKTSVQSREALENLKEEAESRRHKRKRGKGGKKAKRRSSSIGDDDDDDDDGQSSGYNSSSSDSEGDEEGLDVSSRRQKQILERIQRLKRRRAGQPAPPRPQNTKKWKRTTKKAKAEEKDGESDDEMPRELSAYEKRREERILRNQRVLMELGLAGSFSEYMSRVSKQ